MKNPNRSGDAINLDVNLVHAVEQWRTKHGVKGDDPIIAIAELFDIYLRNSRTTKSAADSATLSFETFRAFAELFDARSRTFVVTASELAEKLSRFGELLQRLRWMHFATNIFAAVLGIVIGCLIRLHQ